jgi:hypothetical protein
MCDQAMLLAFEAILGHRSAHSLATGPVMALPGTELYTCLENCLIPLI